MSKKKLFVRFKVKKRENPYAIRDVKLELEIPKYLMKKAVWKKINEEKIFWEEYLGRYHQIYNRRHKERDRERHPRYFFNIKSWIVNAASRAVKLLKERNGRVKFTKAFISYPDRLIIWGIMIPSGEFDGQETKRSLYEVIF